MISVHSPLSITVEDSLNAIDCLIRCRRTRVVGEVLSATRIAVAPAARSSPWQGHLP